jgi:hypothetical protein
MVVTAPPEVPQKETIRLALADVVYEPESLRAELDE